MGLTLACLLVALRPGSTSQLRREPDADPAFLPVESVNFIQMNYPSARIFNQYDWGGYLIYRLWPQNHPFIDGRGEIYAVQPGWEQILSRYDVDLVVIRNNTSLAGALESDPGWRLAHQDRISVIYTRNEKVH
jgi:hypothetical protein